MFPTTRTNYRTTNSFSAPEEVARLEIDTKRIEIPTEFVFDIENPNWTNKDEHNKFFIRGYENMLNDQLRAVGHVFLNDVLKSLGIKPIIAGQLAGWTSGTFIKIEVFETVYRENGLHHYNLQIVPQGIIISELPAK